MGSARSSNRSGTDGSDPASDGSGTRPTRCQTTDDAAISFGDAAWNLRQLIERNFETVRCRTYLGGTFVNHAIASLDAQSFDLAFELLDQAEVELNTVLASTPQERLAERFLFNVDTVRINTLVEHSLKTSLRQAGNPQLVSQALSEAQRALAIRESRDSAQQVTDETRLCYALAAAYAASGNFESAIGWQERAIETAPDKAKAWYRKRLEKLQRGERLGSK